jgi:hypothetical protein
MLSSLGSLSTALRVLPWCASVLLGLLCWHFDARAAANAATIRTQAMQFKAAQSNAAQMMQQALQQAAATYRDDASNAQQSFQAQLAAAHAAAGAYIAADRVRPQTTAGSGSTAASVSATNETGLSESMPAGAVVVSADDVQACSAVATYALQAHDWAASLGK